MRSLIKNDLRLCIGCNRCIRFCPVEGANVAYHDGEEIKVKVNNDQCIVCGSCIESCQHESRDFTDDTERFLSDLRSGISISLFTAPAIRTNSNNFGRLLTWLRQKGVKHIYDVSLGADICTWAHIRYIQQHNPKTIITQPCPAIVNYVLIHNHDLMKYISPIQSPMLCTAIYMKRYENIHDKIAALSPCIAKSNEFDATGYVEYNVTFKKLFKYIKEHNIQLPHEESGFDHMESALGCLFPMPGGLKENVEFYLGKALRIDKSEGTATVYKALKEFSAVGENCHPDVFDVLNCQEGCNLGTGCIHEKNIFEINTIMDFARRDVVEGRDKEEFDAVFEEYDNTLELSHFIRKYTAQNARNYNVSHKQIEEGFDILDKKTNTDRKIDCSACGANSCYDMARHIALDLNVPENCIQKVRNDVHREHEAVLATTTANFKNVHIILDDISKIKDLSEEINQRVTSINAAIEDFNNMSKNVDKIAMQINLISLNASIEAARAGEFGKAFNVVAEEIRRLANSSKETVAETEEVIANATNSIQGINNMVSQISVEVEKAFKNISEITDKTDKSFDKTREDEAKHHVSNHDDFFDM